MVSSFSRDATRTRPAVVRQESGDALPPPSRTALFSYLALFASPRLTPPSPSLQVSTAFSPGVLPEVLLRNRGDPVGAENSKVRPTCGVPRTSGSGVLPALPTLFLTVAPSLCHLAMMQVLAVSSSGLLPAESILAEDSTIFDYSITRPLHQLTVSVLNYVCDARRVGRL